MNIEIRVRRVVRSEPSIMSAVSAIFSVIWFFI